MKKITKLIAGLTFLTSMLMLSGCGLKNYAKYDTWYKYNKEGGLDIPLCQTDAENAATTGTLTNAEFYLLYNQENGLTIAIQSSKTENVQLYDGLISIDQKITVGATKQYTKEQFGPVSWTALIPLGNFTECGAPKIVTNPDECVVVNNLTDKNFQWRKIFANILIEQLLGA